MNLEGLFGAFRSFCVAGAVVLLACSSALGEKVDQGALQTYLRWKDHDVQQVIELLNGVSDKKSRRWFELESLSVFDSLEEGNFGESLMLSFKLQKAMKDEQWLKKIDADSLQPSFKLKRELDDAVERLQQRNMMDDRLCGHIVGIYESLQTNIWGVVLCRELNRETGDDFIPESLLEYASSSLADKMLAAAGILKDLKDGRKEYLVVSDLLDIDEDLSQLDSTLCHVFRRLEREAENGIGSPQLPRLMEAKKAFNAQMKKLLLGKVMGEHLKAVSVRMLDRLHFVGETIPDGCAAP